MQTVPFTTSATTIPFTPSIQDAEKFLRQKKHAISAREQANERERGDLDTRFDAKEIEEAEYDREVERLDIEMERIVEEWPAMEATYAAMKKRFPTPQTFLIAVPTSVERDQINSRLVALGLTQVTQEQIRATMIEQLFLEDWAKPGETLTPAENEARAEETANFLDSVWLRQKAHDDAIEIWTAQERERLLDTEHGAPKREAAPEPPRIISMRDVARASLLADRMMSGNQTLRDLAAKQMDFARENSLLIVRMHVVGVEGFTPTIPLEREPRTRALPAAAVNALRDQVDDNSWLELVSYIDRLYSVDEAERKNSDWLLEKQPHQDGSIELTAGSVDNGGNSTISSTSPAHDDASEKITATSFGSTSGSGTAAPRPANDSPTAAE